jgi:hypothetical protein
MELRESILRILSKNGGQPFSAQDVACALSIPRHKAYARIRLAVKEKLIRQANEPQKTNKKHYVPTEAGIEFLPDPGDIYREIMPAGKTVRFIHPITGEVVTYKS